MCVCVCGGGCPLCVAGHHSAANCIDCGDVQRPSEGVRHQPDGASGESVVTAVGNIVAACCWKVAAVVKSDFWCPMMICGCLNSSEQSPPCAWNKAGPPLSSDSLMLAGVCRERETQQHLHRVCCLKEGTGWPGKIERLEICVCGV